MLTQKMKVGILIGGAMIVFGIVIAILFDVFPSNTPDPTETTSDTNIQDVSFLEEEPVTENATFDVSNKNDLFYYGEETTEKGTLEKEAQDIAIFFIERFGSYSSSAGFTYIDELTPFMSSNMQSWIRTYKNQQPIRDTHFSVVSEVRSYTTESLSLTERKARINLMVTRTESTSVMQTYEQKVSVALVQNNTGEWLIDGVFWGDRIE